MSCNVYMKLKGELLNAREHTGTEIFNLGTGKAYSVLELIHAFEEVNVDMKIDNDYNMQSYENNNQYKEKIEQNYNKIVNGKDNGNLDEIK